ncbi:hypothetical protein PR048_022307 [Dryococelus australis]|uniref:BED-type domain-containing protein n=1 Tax=Dryococelus australis TaxID=614101 RepID=A0ABQ9H0N7_9NEOP|nr:hypothetical protein PR048_022307 [Dryococelus australis]
MLIISKCQSFSVATFNDKYTDEFDWMGKHPNCKTNAVCKLCDVKISIASVGRTALFSHANETRSRTCHFDNSSDVIFAMFKYRCHIPVPDLRVFLMMKYPKQKCYGL